jgi:pimeloyl-ACP methyl ester carboxylesterase
MRFSFRPTHAVAGLLLSLLCVSANAEETPGPHNRAEATQIISDLRRITTPQGIERLQKVRIGGIDQWVSVRGTDPRNPVLLMLHGGPGWVSMPTSWYFQRGWEEYFTVVQWDQRGAGKTYAANDPATVAPTMTRDRMLADTEEMVKWLRTTLKKDKIFVMGTSWGSYLGLELARRQPNWLHAYIGMGQLTSAPESERRAWAWTLAQAREKNNEQAIRELKALAPYSQDGAPPSLPDLFVLRKWLNEYGGMVHGRNGGGAEAAAAQLAPEYTDADLATLWEANEYSMDHLLSSILELDLSTIRQLDCPLILFLGRHDTNVSSSLASEWFAKVQAPSKKLVWFEDSAHEVVNEEPGKALISLVLQARPIAERAGDSAPK